MRCLSTGQRWTRPVLIFSLLKFSAKHNPADIGRQVVNTMIDADRQPKTVENHVYRRCPTEQTFSACLFKPLTRGSSRGQDLISRALPRQSRVSSKSKNSFKNIDPTKSGDIAQTTCENTLLLYLSNAIRNNGQNTLSSR